MPPEFRQHLSARGGVLAELDLERFDRGNRDRKNTYFIKSILRLSVNSPATIRQK